MKLLLKLFL